MGKDNEPDIFEQWLNKNLEEAKKCLEYEYSDAYYRSIEKYQELKPQLKAQILNELFDEIDRKVRTKSNGDETSYPKGELGNLFMFREDWETFKKAHLNKKEG